MNVTTMYEAVPVVSELNRVKGFDPLKYLRRTEDGPKMDLKMKKLWFRLKYPNGRIKLTALKITDQLALIEARVYFDKKDEQPAASFTAQRERNTTPGGLYVEAAQYVATDMALTDAGFGIQLVPAPEGGEVAQPVMVQSVVDTKPEQKAEPTVEPVPVEAVQTVETVAPSEPEPAVETVVQEEPVQEELRAEDAPSGEMTLEQAGDVIVPAGTCKGWTLKQVAERRPVSLKWFVTAYNGDDETFRKAAKMVYDNYEMMKAA